MERKNAVFFLPDQKVEKIEKCEIDDATSFLPASEWRADSMHTLFQKWNFIPLIELLKNGLSWGDFGTKIQISKIM